MHSMTAFLYRYNSGHFRVPCVVFRIDGCLKTALEKGDGLKFPTAYHIHDREGFEKHGWQRAIDLFKISFGF